MDGVGVRFSSSYLATSSDCAPTHPKSGWGSLFQPSSPHLRGPSVQLNHQSELRLLLS